MRQRYAAEEAERRLERERQEQFRKDKEAYEEKQREKQKAEADARKAALDAAKTQRTIEFWQITYTECHALTL